MLTKTITPLQRLEFAFQLMAGGMEYINPTGQPPYGSGGHYLTPDVDYTLRVTDSLIKAAGFNVVDEEPSEDTWRPSEAVLRELSELRQRYKDGLVDSHEYHQWMDNYLLPPNQ